MKRDPEKQTSTVTSPSSTILQVPIFFCPLSPSAINFSSKPSNLTMSFRRSRRHRRNGVVIVRASSAYNVSAARTLRRQPSQFFDVSFWDGLDDPGLHDDELMDTSLSFKKAITIEPPENRAKDAFLRRSSRRLKRHETSWTTRSDSRDEQVVDLRCNPVEEDADVPIREISFKRESDPWSESESKRSSSIFRKLILFKK